MPRKASDISLIAKMGMLEEEIAMIRHENIVLRDQIKNVSLSRNEVAQLVDYSRYFTGPAWSPNTSHEIQHWDRENGSDSDATTDNTDYEDTDGDDYGSAVGHGEAVTGDQGCQQPTCTAGKTRGTGRDLIERDGQSGSDTGGSEEVESTTPIPGFWGIDKVRLR